MGFVIILAKEMCSLTQILTNLCKKMSVINQPFVCIEKDVDLRSENIRVIFTYIFVPLLNGRCRLAKGGFTVNQGQTERWFSVKMNEINKISFQRYNLKGVKDGFQNSILKV